MQTTSNIIGIFDRQINAWFFGLRNTVTEKVFFGFTTLGEAAFVIILALIISAFLWRWRKNWQIAAMWVAIIGSEATTYILKLFFDRARPAGALVLESSSSFPSGHATIAIAFYGFLAYLLLREIKKYRPLTLVVSIIIILAIGFSRLYLGVHYLSDVLAGYLVGAVWLAIGIKIDKLKSISNRCNLNL